MKNIDFLPARFHEAVLRRRRNRKNIAMCAMLAVGLMGLHLINGSQLREARASLKVFESDELEREQQEARIEVLCVRKRVLSQRQSLISDLDDDASCDLVLAQITRLMSKQMAIRSLELDVQPAVAEGDGEVDVVLNRGRTRVLLVGVAQSDIDVGVFVGRLTACPLFENVQLKYSRSAASGGSLDRLFELGFTVKRVSTGTQDKAI